MKKDEARKNRFKQEYRVMTNLLDDPIDDRVTCGVTEAMRLMGLPFYFYGWHRRSFTQP
jgi:hypothetical protein